MTNTLANIARVLSTTTGTGTLTLGSAVSGFNTFANAGVTDGQTVTYAIEDYSSDTPATVVGREIGQGVYSAGTLTRGTVYSSTLAGAKINCSGRQHVFVTAAKEDFDSLAIASDLTAHLSDTADAHDASAISFSATGNIASTDVQAAIAELDSEKLSTATAASTYQPLDSDLTTLAANITTFGHSLVDDANASAARTTLGLVIGTDVQAQDVELAAIAGLTSAADRLPYFTGSGTASLATFTTAGRALVDDADAAAQRITLGLALVDYQEFTSSGTWTKPTSVAPTLVYVELAGAGGGGGGGARTASGNASSGGGGGGGAAYMRGWFRASALSATETITIGATGGSGAGATSDGVAGSNGTAGGNSTFGSRLTAYGGGFGAGGQLAGNSGGGGGAGWQGSGGNASGATAGSAGTLGGQAGGSGGSGTAGASSGVGSGGGGGTNAAAGSNANLTMDGGGGGGSGGGISAAPAAFSGGNGGRTLTYNVGTVSGGSAGNPGTSPTASLTAGGGGAGAGGSNAAGVGGAGGTGAQPGGGGGGGGSAVGGNGGAGGAGGSGICRVWSFA